MREEELKGIVMNQENIIHGLEEQLKKANSVNNAQAFTNGISTRDKE